MADGVMSAHLEHLQPDRRYTLVLAVRYTTGTLVWTPVLRGSVHTEPAVPDVQVEITAKLSGQTVQTTVVPLATDANGLKVVLKPYAAPEPIAGRADSALDGPFEVTRHGGVIG